MIDAWGEQAAESVLERLSAVDVLALAYDWDLWRRAEQAPPADVDWLCWLILAGRGWGKTRTGAETVRAWVNARLCRRVHLIARTAADGRETMVRGESGLIACCEGDVGNVPAFKPSRSCVEWPNGAQAFVFSSESPDALRGPQCDGWWADELAAWRRDRETWDNLQMGARLGRRVRGVITTTPRPTSLLRELLGARGTVVTRGTTYDNLANLSDSVRVSILDRYEGTRLGRQELHGEILDDNPRVLWKREWLEALRVVAAPANLERIVVAVDPAASSGEGSDETGIVAAGRRRPTGPIAPGGAAEFYVLGDFSLRGTPHEWASAVVHAYRGLGADRIVYEANQGGEMVAHVLRTLDGALPLSAVRASRGKWTRAEPVAALYEQGRVRHVGAFADLEDQMCSWEPGAEDSPDRLDALVWAISALMEADAVRPVDRWALGF